MKSDKKVLYLVNIPSPYMVNFFNSLAKKVNLTVIFERKYDNTRDISWKFIDLSGFRHFVLRGIIYNHEQIIPLKYKKYFKEHYDFIFIQNFFTPSGIIITRYLKKKNIPYIIISEGGYIKSKNLFKDMLKKFTVSNALLYFSSSSHTDDFLNYYGANFNNIIRYNFTSLSRNQILKKPLTRKEKHTLRNKYDLPLNDLIILSVGRLSKEKNHKYIIDNLKHVKRPFLLILIGDGSDVYTLTQLSLINHVRIKHLDTNILFDYYRLADIFALASSSEPWGLVVNEAMSQGCVVATSQYVNASKELVSNSNGFIFDINNKFAFADLIENMKVEILDEMSHNSLKLIKDYTIENKIKTFLEFLKI